VPGQGGAGRGGRRLAGPGPPLRAAPRGGRQWSDPERPGGHGAAQAARGGPRAGREAGRPGKAHRRVVHELNNPLWRWSCTPTRSTPSGAAAAATRRPGEDRRDPRRRPAHPGPGARAGRLRPRPATGPLEPLEVAPLLELATQVCRQALKEAGGGGAARPPAGPGGGGGPRGASPRCSSTCGQRRPGQPEAGGGAARARRRRRPGAGDRGRRGRGGCRPRSRRGSSSRSSPPGPRAASGWALRGPGIVERHGGAISLVESAPGQGTRITVTLPASPFPAQDSGVRTA